MNTRFLVESDKAWLVSYGEIVASSHWFVTMQTDDHLCCQKTGLLKSREKFNILVGVTGSVAALKLPLLVSQLLQLPGVSYGTSLVFFHWTTISISKRYSHRSHGVALLLLTRWFVIVIAKLSKRYVYICNINTFKMQHFSIQCCQEWLAKFCSCFLFNFSRWM